MRRGSVRRRPSGHRARSPTRGGARAAAAQKGEWMFKITRKETNWGGRKLVLETGRIARQADGAVLAT